MEVSMPWEERNEMDQRLLFISRWQKGRSSIKELCEEFGISRTLGHKLINRYKEKGIEGVSPYSRRPRSSPNMTSEEMVCEIVKLRLKHENWGGRSIHEVLSRKYNDVPSSRTIDRILERSSLVAKRRKARSRYVSDGTIIKPKESNDVWTADFKGWWRMKNGEICYPLTIRDEHSRYVINLSAHESPSFRVVKRQFKECFEKYGLPKYIRSDNGGPFAAMYALQGLSQLSAWWVSLGILPNRTKPASPYMNGAHERMHRDIKHDLQRNPERNILDQQKAFDKWIQYFNLERPHQALKMKTPAECYSESVRIYDSIEPEYQYSSQLEVRKVDCRGHIYWNNNKHFISGSLVKRKIGIKREDNQQLSVWYCNMLLGYTDYDFRSPIITL